MLACCVCALMPVSASAISLLLADAEFDRLTVCDVTGSCGLVELQPEVQSLKQAVFSNGKLYVLSAIGFKLSVYSADVTALELMQ